MIESEENYQYPNVNPSIKHKKGLFSNPSATAPPLRL